MNNNKVSSFQFACLIIYPILSLFSGIGMYNVVNNSGVDAYIAVIIAMILGFLVLGMFLLILNYKEDLTLPEKNICLFGKIIGNGINYFVNILVMVMGILLIYSISDFIISQFLTETPVIIILIFLGLTSIYSVTKGIEVIARTGVTFFIIIIILTIISTFGLIPLFDFSNIKPVLEYGLNKPILGGISLCLTNILSIIILLIIPKKKIFNKEKLPKYLIFAYLISMLFIFLATILTSGVLGIQLLKLFPNPEYMVLKKISILGFLDRIENIIYVKWLLNDFISFVLIIYFISNSIKKNDKQYVLPITITILICLLSQLLFKDNTKFKLFIHDIYPYINLILLGIFVIISLNIIIRKVIKKEV
jgi:spore germination protein KB